MAIGHHINDRSHVIEKEMNPTGDLEERQEFINLEEGRTRLNQRSLTLYYVPFDYR